MSYDELKKKFYAKCLNFRIKGVPKATRREEREVQNKDKEEMGEVNGSERNRNLDQISGLFKEVLDKKIPIEKWDQFIYENLLNEL